ncbi:MAG: DUF294 nucleotidyltransferase-like domain-containing protein [Albidovulum sp.]|nr:DUF294 nucleotidyltransferase-like domain-containing protein [Albidovulum sp.]
MSFESRISKAPLTFGPEAGAFSAEDFSARYPSFRDLALGAASCSPYLRGLMERHREWAAELPAREPEDAFKEILNSSLSDSAGKAAEELRVAKQKAALLVALADLGGVWNLGGSTRTLTEFADYATNSLLLRILAEFARRKRLGPLRESDLEENCGLFALAMGKMGGRELNYSSDIDLVVLFDLDLEDSDLDAVRRGFIRATQRLASLLSHITANGYVFRTDLRLRPDPRATQVCMSVQAAEHYFEAYGRTWERAAYIKARPCAGDLRAGARFLRAISPFVWRKHLDFATLAEAKDMRSRMRRHKGLVGQIQLPGYDIKLGQGGIREIEFFAQAFQIIAGGRDRSLRSPSTLDALAALEAKGWIEADCCSALSRNYVFHRDIEHRLQMIHDARTHSLPSSPVEFERFSCLCGESNPDSLRKSIMRSLEEVQAATANLFQNSNAGTADGSEASSLADSEKFTERWRSYPVMRESRAREIFASLQPRFLARLERAANPGEALKHFEGFLSGLPAGVQLFSLFMANEQLVDLLVDTCTTAPGLASYLSRNAKVFDAVIYGDFFEPFPNAETLQSQLAREMENASDYESKLDDARRWMKEKHFRIGVHQLQGIISAEEAAKCYGDLAEAVIAAIWPAALRQFENRHGAPPGEGACIVAMGSLGAGSLTPQSDLDLLLIFDEGQDDYSNGPKPLAARNYYARLTQAVVAAISAPTSEGKLYSVDMRLRPSGRQGPVAVSIHGFLDYQLRKAWTWEHLALTRARPITGSASLIHLFESVRRKVIISKRSNRGVILKDVRDMRTRLAKHADSKRVGDPWETRLGPGRLLDIDLLAHSATLLAGSSERMVAGQIKCGGADGWIDDDGLALLLSSYGLLRKVLQVARLTFDGKFRPEAAGTGASELLLRETGENSIEALAMRLNENKTLCDRLFSRLLN